jgi:hypothetical protein
MFHACKKLAGYRLVADDAPWPPGKGTRSPGRSARCCCS